MIKGKLIDLHLVTEKKLDELYGFHLDIANRGEYFPLKITPEPLYKSKFRETGFWSDDYSQLLIINQDKIVGSIWTMKTVPYFDALEIGYIIYSKEDCGKGYVTEALLLFIDYIFKIKLISRLEIRILPSHIASEKVAIKCGFTFEGVIREAIFHHGQYQDLRQFSLLRKEWQLLKTGVSSSPSGCCT
jgi:ribosomal-protein-alanine N-acetyltransferase